MKPLLPTPEGLTISKIQDHFDSEEKARAYLETVRWPDGPVCPHCHNHDEKPIWKIEPNAKKKIREGLYHCSACNKQFTVTVGTIFEDSHIPLRKWLWGFYLLCSSKKGISSLQIQRILGLGSYRTALFMMHRIRHALSDPIFQDKLTGTVEADETYVGGKYPRRKGKSFDNKTPVVAMVERGGRVRAEKVKYVNAYTLKKTLKKHVADSADLMTDQHSGYTKVGRPFKSHGVVNHSIGEYVRGNAYTNTVEGFFSLLKRGIVGTFHHVSEKHLPLYLAEFNHRYNTRKDTDGERTVAGLAKAEGKRLTYKPMVSK